jgi:hypothetical protein
VFASFEAIFEGHERSTGDTNLDVGVVKRSIVAEGFCNVAVVAIKLVQTINEQDQFCILRHTSYDNLEGRAEGRKASTTPAHL